MNVSGPGGAAFNWLEGLACSSIFAAPARGSSLQILRQLTATPHCTLSAFTYITKNGHTLFIVGGHLMFFILCK